MMLKNDALGLSLITPGSWRDAGSPLRIPFSLFRVRHHETHHLPRRCSVLPYACPSAGPDGATYRRPPV